MHILVITIGFKVFMHLIGFNNGYRMVIEAMVSDIKVVQLQFNEFYLNYSYQRVLK